MPLIPNESENFRKLNVMLENKFKILNKKLKRGVILSILIGFCSSYFINFCYDYLLSGYNILKNLINVLIIVVLLILLYNTMKEEE